MTQSEGSTAYVGNKPSNADRALSRRSFLRWSAAATIASVGLAGSPQLALKGFALEPDVFWDGEVFDAGGANVRIASWPGFWKELEQQNVIDDFEKDFNAKVKYDGNFPWFPKFVAGGANNPPFAATNWNLPEMNKTALTVDPFLPQEQLKANLPHGDELWPFAWDNGVGVTYLFSQYGYVWRRDLAETEPDNFADWWLDAFDGRRGTYITVNTLFMVHFMVTSDAFGKGPTDIEAGLQAYKDAVPMKVSDFTGNMQLLVERGEVIVGVQHDGEGLLQKIVGVPVEFLYWGIQESDDTQLQPALTQTLTMSKNVPLIEKKLAAAFIDRHLTASYQESAGGPPPNGVLLRPTNQNATVAAELTLAGGVENDADALASLWIPPWKDFWIPNEQEISTKVNEIFGGG